MTRNILKLNVAWMENFIKFIISSRCEMFSIEIKEKCRRYFPFSYKGAEEWILISGINYPPRSAHQRAFRYYVFCGDYAAMFSKLIIKFVFYDRIYVLWILYWIFIFSENMVSQDLNLCVISNFGNWDFTTVLIYL